MAEPTVDIIDPDVEVKQVAIVHNAEIDAQISTAKQYPRSSARFVEAARTIIQFDQETAASCFYVLKRGGKQIEGPSVRLAEVILSSYQNLRVATEVLNDDGRFVYARAAVHDLENNVAFECTTKRRITNRDGKTYNDDMIQTTGNAAASIALRNAVLRAVPGVFVQKLYQEARQFAIGGSEPLSVRRQKLVDTFSKLGVGPEQVCAFVERSSIDEVTPDDLADLIGVYTAIKDGMTTVDQCFGTGASEEQVPVAKSILNALKLQEAQASE